MASAAASGDAELRLAKQQPAPRSKDAAAKRRDALSTIACDVIVRREGSDTSFTRRVQLRTGRDVPGDFQLVLLPRSGGDAPPGALRDAPPAAPLGLEETTLKIASATPEQLAKAAGGALPPSLSVYVRSAVTEADAAAGKLFTLTPWLVEVDAGSDPAGAAQWCAELLDAVRLWKSRRKAFLKTLPGAAPLGIVVPRGAGHKGREDGEEEEEPSEGAAAAGASSVTGPAVPGSPVAAVAPGAPSAAVAHGQSLLRRLRRAEARAHEHAGGQRGVAAGTVEALALPHSGSGAPMRPQARQRDHGSERPALPEQQQLLPPLPLQLSSRSSAASSSAASVSCALASTVAAAVPPTARAGEHGFGQQHGPYAVSSHTAPPLPAQLPPLPPGYVLVGAPIVAVQPQHVPYAAAVAAVQAQQYQQYQYQQHYAAALAHYQQPQAQAYTAHQQAACLQHAAAWQQQFAAQQHMAGAVAAAPLYRAQQPPTEVQGVVRLQR